jgi:hypothetical protein
MKELKLSKDWEIMNKRVIRAGSTVSVPDHIAQQLIAAGFISAPAPKVKPQKKQ